MTRANVSDPYHFRGIDKSTSWQETGATHIWMGLHVWVLRGVPSADVEITARLVSPNIAGGVPVAPRMWCGLLYKTIS